MGFKILLGKAKFPEIVQEFQATHDACRKASEEGDMGAVLCQVGMDDENNTISIRGQFLPHNYAVRISQILKEYQQESS